jgi:anti-sigma regulatory factor (Ser/Thr protein kinase)
LAPGGENGRVNAGAGSFELPRTLHAAQEARSRVARMLRSRPQSVVEDALVVVTELVTNSVRHSPSPEAQPIVVHVTLTERSLGVRVCDPGHGLDPLTLPRPRDTGGWGLLLVDRLSTRWGIETNDQTCVWAEFDVAPTDAAG